MSSKILIVVAALLCSPFFVSAYTDLSLKTEVTKGSNGVTTVKYSFTPIDADYYVLDIDCPVGIEAFNGSREACGENEIDGNKSSITTTFKSNRESDRVVEAEIIGYDEAGEEIGGASDSVLILGNRADNNSDRDEGEDKCEERNLKDSRNDDDDDNGNEDDDRDRDDTNKDEYEDCDDKEDNKNDANKDSRNDIAIPENNEAWIQQLQTLLTQLMERLTALTNSKK